MQKMSQIVCCLISKIFLFDLFFKWHSRKDFSFSCFNILKGETLKFNTYYLLTNGRVPTCTIDEQYENNFKLDCIMYFRSY